MIVVSLPDCSGGVFMGFFFKMMLGELAGEFKGQSAELTVAGILAAV